MGAGLNHGDDRRGRAAVALAGWWRGHGSGAVCAIEHRLRPDRSGWHGAWPWGGNRQAQPQARGVVTGTVSSCAGPRRVFPALPRSPGHWSLQDGHLRPWLRPARSAARPEGTARHRAAVSKQYIWLSRVMSLSPRGAGTSEGTGSPRPHPVTVGPAAAPALMNDHRACGGQGGAGERPGAGGGCAADQPAAGRESRGGRDEETVLPAWAGQQQGLIIQRSAEAAWTSAAWSSGVDPAAWPPGTSRFDPPRRGGDLDRHLGQHRQACACCPHRG